MEGQQSIKPAEPQPISARAIAAPALTLLVPGLGHVLLKKWDRALVFFGVITVMFFLGLYLEGRLFSPEFSDLFAVLKFTADAGNGLLYWVCWVQGLGIGNPSAYTYDFGNVFVFIAGLLNMLVAVDAYDIALRRKP